MENRINEGESAASNVQSIKIIRKEGIKSDIV
jgi:hypothetical protein